MKRESLKWLDFSVLYSVAFRQKVGRVQTVSKNPFWIFCEMSMFMVVLEDFDVQNTPKKDRFFT